MDPILDRYGISSVKRLSAILKLLCSREFLSRGKAFFGDLSGDQDEENDARIQELGGSEAFLAEVAAQQDRICLATLRSLRTLVRHCWPRIGNSHAEAILLALDSNLARKREQQTPSPQIQEAEDNLRELIRICLEEKKCREQTMIKG